MNNALVFQETAKSHSQVHWRSCRKQEQEACFWLISKHFRLFLRLDREFCSFNETYNFGKIIHIVTQFRYRQQNPSKS